MRKTVELCDLDEVTQREVLDFAVDTGYPLNKYMALVNAGIAAAMAGYDLSELEVGGE